MSSLVVFARDVIGMAAFYEGVLALEPLKDDWGGVRLRGSNEEVLIHPVSSDIAATIDWANSREPRTQSSLKPAFDVASLGEALNAVRSKGGFVTEVTFSIDGLTRHDVVDPEGNVIQLRSRNP